MGRLSAKEALIVTIGIVTVSTYLTTSAGLIEAPPILIRILVFSIGPIAILAVLRISKRLEGFGKPSWRMVATTYLVIAFSLFTLMIVVQQSVLARFDEMKPAEKATTTSLSDAFRLVNQVQLGIDVCFDIFYCLGIILLSYLLTADRPYGAILAVLGTLSAFSLLVMNVVAFPEPPSDAGLLDLGPVTGVWWILLIIYLGRLRRMTTVVEVGRLEDS